MNKTLCITLEYPPQKGGVATYLFGLLASLDPQKIIVLTSSSSETREAPHRVLRKKLLASWIRPRWIPMLLAAFWIIRREGIQQLLAGDALPSGRVCYLLHRLFKIPYSVFTYGMELPLASGHSRHARELQDVFRNAKHIFTISSYTAGLLQKVDPTLPAPTFIYPCPAKRLTPAPKEKAIALRRRLGVEGKTVLLCVSRLVERKGHSQILRAIEKLRRAHLFFLIVGDGPNRQALERQVQSLQLRSSIAFEGEVSDHDLPAYYAASDIFCMANRELPEDVEGFGIVFLEANMYGLPVIGGRNGGAPDAVIDGETGLLVDSEKIDDIARAIARLDDSAELRKRLGENGRKRVEAFFRYDIQGKILESLL